MAEELEVFRMMDHLPDDLSRKVFSFLDSREICRAALVCKKWRAATADEFLWMRLNFDNCKISVDQFEDVCRRYPNASEVNVSKVKVSEVDALGDDDIFGAPGMHLIAEKAALLLRNLETLTLGRNLPIMRGRLPGNIFSHALADCHTLRTLHVANTMLGDLHQEFPVNHDGLRHLRLESCLAKRISVRCPQLESLSLYYMIVMDLVEFNCPLVRELDLGSLSDDLTRALAISCPLLESLDISMIPNLTDESLREIASKCANLRTVNASLLTSISLESMTFPALRVLKLDRCMGITPASMAAISRSRMLEDLEINNGSLLTSVSLDLPCLKRIKVVHCRDLADLNLRARNQNLMLSSVMVSECPALRRVNVSTDSLQVYLLMRDQYLPAVLLNRVKLTQKLVLKKQENMKILVLQCESLQEVDVSDCESLRDSESGMDVDGCPVLKSVVLENCETLTTARFRSTSLESLSLGECQAPTRPLTTLELACPRLPEVCLDSCFRLERASFCPVGFRSLNLGICPKLSTLAIEAPEMDVLELKGCGKLSKASIICPALTSLDASYCRQLKDESFAAAAASCPLIETLISTSCESIGYEGLRSLCQLPHLTTLDLSYTFLTNLLPVFESCLQLKVLRLQKCEYLTDSSLEPLYKQGALPSLQELDLSFGFFNQAVIEELLACCTHLSHLSLNGCVNLRGLYLTYGPDGGSSDTIQSESKPSNKQPERLLESLNCVGCPNIRKVFIRGSTKCFHLSSLNLSLSNNLKEVDISCPELRFLYLRNCSSLDILKLDCPSLIGLSVQACNIDEEMLEAAISRSIMLETLDIRFSPKIQPVSTGRLRTLCRSF